MKHLKLFQTEAEYTAYKDSEDFVLPNVSYAVDSVKLYYNPYVKETKLVCTYNVTDTTNSIKLCNNASNFASMEVDGVLQDSITTGYTFDTVGEHTVKFELADPTSIGNEAFNGCINLTSITIPDSVTSIGHVAFNGCINLTSITIPDSVTSIGQVAFAGCTGLTSVEIGSSVTTIDSRAFYNCSNVKELYYNAPISLDPSLVQEGMREKLENVVIGNSTPEIKNNVFYSCYNLTSIKIGSGVTSIGNDAFAGCSGLKSISIPDSVTSIDDRAFYGCSNLTSVTIGNSVNSIGIYVFNGCSELNEIACLATTAPSISGSTFANIKENGILKVPTGSDYSSWMSTDDYYLGKYNWTVEYI